MPQAWQLVGSAGFTPDFLQYTSLAFHPSTSRPYLSYQDGNASSRATVMAFDGSATWAPVGLPGFSTGMAMFTSLALQPNSSIPYVAYQDGYSPGSATVMAYDGSAWGLVGLRGFSAGFVAFTSLAMEPNSSIPYLAYQDGGHSSKATVMRFDGSAWLTVGLAGFSAGAAAYTSLAFAPDTSVAYVAYKDGGTSPAGKATVMRFDGSAWLTVGSAGFSGTVSTFIAGGLSLAIQPNSSLPHVAYLDGGNSDAATVMAFDGASTWAPVGLAGATARFICLAFSPTSQPYVAYVHYASSQKASVQVYDGAAAWRPVGATDFSNGSVSYLSFGITATNELYIAFQDGSNSGAGTVMKYAAVMQSAGPPPR